MAELSATKSSADLLADVDLGSCEEAEKAESVEDAGVGSSSGSRRRRSPELTPRPAEKEDEVVVEDGEPDVELTPGDAIELDGVDGQGDDASASMQAGPSNEGKRVKVYELRDASWYDRGTGHCKGVYDHSQDLALLIVEAEDTADKPGEGEGEGEGPGGFLKEELLLSARVEKEDIYARQQDTLIVWTEPSTHLDIALSFQDPDGCEDIWQFITEVQRHLNGMPLDNEPAVPATSSPTDSPVIGPVQGDAPARIPWEPPTLRNIKDQEGWLRMQAKSAAGRERAVEHILNEHYIKALCSVFESAEDLEDLEDLHHLCALMQTILLFNDNGIFEYILQDEVFMGVIGMLEYDPEFPGLKASYRQFFQDIARFREVVPIKDENILHKIHQTYRVLYLKDVVLARVLDDPTFGILNGFVFYNQADIISWIQTNDAFLTDLFADFKSLTLSPDTHVIEPLDEKKRDVMLFLHQLMLMGKGIQVQSRLGLYRNLMDRGLFSVCEWAFRRPEPQMLHAAAESLTLAVEHDVNAVRMHVLKEEEAKRRTLLVEMINLMSTTKNMGLVSQISDSMRTLLETAIEAESFLGRKEGPIVESFITFFYDTSCNLLFKPVIDLPEITADMDPPYQLSREQATLLLQLVELLSYCLMVHSHRGSYFILSNPISRKVVSLLYIKHKPLRHAALRFIKSCLKSQNHFIHRYFVKNDLLAPLFHVLEHESGRDNMLSSACMDVLDLIRKENVKPIINYLFDTYRPRIEALVSRPYLRGFIVRLTARWEQNNEPPPVPMHAMPEAESSTARRAEAAEEDYFNASDDEEPGPKSPITTTMLPSKRRPRAQGGPPPKRNSGSAISPSAASSSGGPSVSAALGLDYDDASDSDSSSGAASPRIAPTSATSTAELETDLGEVALRMRRKRMEEDEEEEGFAGLLVGAKTRDTQQRPATPIPSKTRDSAPSTPTPTAKEGKGGTEKREGTPVKEKESKRIRLGFSLGRKLGGRG